MVGPVIYTFGNEEQKAQHLPGILSGEVFWCQGYSEPGSGSDLASLKTSAVKEGDHYIVNGQKTWAQQKHMGEVCEQQLCSSGVAEKNITVTSC